MNATRTQTPKNAGPDRPCRFAVGQLVTCDGPFNSGRDAEGPWRRVEAVTEVRWEDGFYGARGRWNPGLWRVIVPGFWAPDDRFTPAPEGVKAGDLVRPGR